MIDKISGKVAYAVMSFGGFMGTGKDYYPLRWNLLTYNPQLEGYEVNVGVEQLRVLRNTASMRHGTGPNVRAFDPSRLVRGRGAVSGVACQNRCRNCGPTDPDASQ